MPLRLIDPSKYGYKSAKLITKITFVEKGEGSMACDIGTYYSPSGEILAGYDHPLDLGAGIGSLPRRPCLLLKGLAEQPIHHRFFSSFLSTSAKL